MSDNNLTSQTSGTIIQIDHINQYKEALIGDLVPRNTSGVPEDEAGSFGTDIYRWLKAVISKTFTNKLSIGAASTESDNPYLDQTTSSLNYRVVANKSHLFYINNVLLYQVSPSFHDFYIGGVLKGQISANGIDGQYFKTDSITSNKLSRAKSLTSVAGGSTSSTGAIAGSGVSITANGQSPVLVKFQSTSIVQQLMPSSGSGGGTLHIRKNSTIVSTVGFAGPGGVHTGNVEFVDYSASGAITYDLYITISSGTVGWSSFEAIAMEL